MEGNGNVEPRLCQLMNCLYEAFCYALNVRGFLLVVLQKAEPNIITIIIAQQNADAGIKLKMLTRYSLMRLKDMHRSRVWMKFAKKSY